VAQDMSEHERVPYSQVELVTWLGGTATIDATVPSGLSTAYSPAGRLGNTAA
jgi:hypothetical protein